MTLYDTWATLRHGGNLLCPGALDSLPDPPAAAWDLHERLRASLLERENGTRKHETPGVLLDVVLENACGLKSGWRKGSAVAATDSERLLDGTVHKPRRLWSTTAGTILAVFTTREARLGIGKGRRPVAHAVEYLRRRGVPFGLLTNGVQWRLIWAEPDSLAWAEWDTGRWLNGDLLGPEFTLLRTLLSPGALVSDSAAPCQLLQAIRDTRRGQGQLSKALGERVRQAVELLLSNRHSVIDPVWDELEGRDLYVAACHFVMRLVTILFAEARELLPVDNPIYHQSYGLKGLQELLERQTPERNRQRASAWQRLLALFRLLQEGSRHPALLLPAYGGDLFKPGNAQGDPVQRALALLESLEFPPDDHVIQRVLDRLTRTDQRVREGTAWRTVKAPVDFTELTSEYIGILYEGLLDYELHKAGDHPVVFLALGDQPALPLDRLEAMDDRTLATLVEKVKAKTTKAGPGEEESEGDDEDQTSDEEPDTEEEVVTDTTAEEPLEESDPRAVARQRALGWARRTALAGRLVTKPRGRGGESARDFEERLDKAAEQLVADTKLPGELYLVRWGGTRKGAGTFYTRPQLTLPTVRRTLEPLMSAPDRVLLTPEQILALKVCDPAMGSGSFLVAALRVLSEAVLASLHLHSRLRTGETHTEVVCDLLPVADRQLPREDFEARLEAIIRRAVVEHCLYGVELDPLAVELARVALWVETLDPRLPFTFLDHKLRCGNALVGAWLDRFRDYPLLAAWRQSPDEKWRGVHHEGDHWAKRLKQFRTSVVDEQRQLLTGERKLPFTGVSNDDLKAAIERVRELYRALRQVPSSQPDKRAAIWRDQVAPDPALARVRQACDLWCALWFWPLDKLADAPTPLNLATPTPAALETVTRLRDERHFFHWELEFP
ncbi:MAG: hypothetical protein KC488_12975, partial [Candidatus Cloacimonetes bacterium]|nr:hypothetical protein [Candidatus Cloacimonadota bacterium]